MAALTTAIQEWREIVGERHVITSGPVLRRVATATYPTTADVAAIVRPGSRKQVQACVRVAHNCQVAVYPISGGKNWGYGSRVPTADGSVVLDLGRMRRILAFDEELGYVTVEPGVTQQLLYDFLQEKGGRFWMDGTGSTPEASLIGNIMERGFGGTENADHVAVSCGYEIVLPDGELLHTGYTAYPSARVAAVDAWSPGPQVQGLFSQSNLGIVTNLSFPLLPAPEHLELLTLDIANREQLITAVDTMRLLQLDGTLRSAPWFGNCYRVLSTLMRFPWHRTEPPLEPELAAEIAREHGISWFTGFASIYGPKQQVLAARRHATALLRRAGVRVEVADRQKLADTPHSARRSVQLSMLRLYSGGVMNATRRAYWRKRMTIPADGDLDNDGVGFIFVNASLPLVGADVAEAGAIGERVVLAHGFEPNFNCISVRPRALLGILTFAWNRDIPGDDERAFAAHDQLADRWAERGWYPLRLGLHSMKLLDKAEPSHRAFVRTLKQAVDPRGIIAPGRY